MKYLDKLVKNYPHAINEEMHYHIGKMSDSLKEHWMIELFGDDRATIACNAIAKWIIESIEKGPPKKD